MAYEFVTVTSLEGKKRSALKISEGLYLVRTYTELTPSDLQNNFIRESIKVLSTIKGRKIVEGAVSQPHQVLIRLKSGKFAAIRAKKCHGGGILIVLNRFPVIL